MKAENYYLVSPQVRQNLLRRLEELSEATNLKVTISDAGSKSAKQRGLEWRWYTEVAESGKGGEWEDTKDGVHLTSKYRWAIPILIRDDENLALLYEAWVKMYGKTPKRMKWFVHEQIHTEKMTTSQMTEYLDDFQRFWSQHVNLTDPNRYGL
jgi:hypothetical protein